jgi:putative PIN family toxin of toxin-antitoxin system
MRAVIDTNITISALFFGGLPRRLVDLAAAGRFRAVTSPELLVELEGVLAEDFAVSQERIDLVVRDVLSYAEVVAPTEQVKVPVRDEADVKVVACAIAGRADCIVTGDRDLLALGGVEGIRVMTVRAFLESRPW